MIQLIIDGDYLGEGALYFSDFCADVERARKYPRRYLSGIAKRKVTPEATRDAIQFALARSRHLFYKEVFYSFRKFELALQKRRLIEETTYPVYKFFVIQAMFDDADAVEFLLRF